MYNKFSDFLGGECPPPPFPTFSLIWGWGHVHLVPYTPMKCRRGAGPDSLKWMFVFDQNLWSNKLSNVVHHMFVNNWHCCNNDGGPYRVLFFKKSIVTYAIFHHPKHSGTVNNALECQLIFINSKTRCFYAPMIEWFGGWGGGVVLSVVNLLLNRRR